MVATFKKASLTGAVAAMHEHRINELNVASSDDATVHSASRLHSCYSTALRSFALLGVCLFSTTLMPSYLIYDDFLPEVGPYSFHKGFIVFEGAL